MIAHPSASALEAYQKTKSGSPAASDRTNSSAIQRDPAVIAYLAYHRARLNRRDGVPGGNAIASPRSPLMRKPREIDAHAEVVTTDPEDHPSAAQGLTDRAMDLRWFCWMSYNALDERVRVECRKIYVSMTGHNVVPQIISDSIGTLAQKLLAMPEH